MTVLTVSLAFRKKTPLLVRGIFCSVFASGTFMFRHYVGNYGLMKNIDKIFDIMTEN